MQNCFPNTVEILRGKFKGKSAIWECYVDKHPLSSEQRSQLRVYCLPYLPCMRTVLMNESGFKVVSWKNSVGEPHD